LQQAEQAMALCNWSLTVTS